MGKTTTRQGVITLHVEMRKSLSRKSLIEVQLNWENVLDLPISGDLLLIDRIPLKVVRGPRPDGVLLDRPQSALDPDEGPTYWYCHHDGEWARVEVLVSEFMKDPRTLSVQVLP